MNDGTGNGRGVGYTENSDTIYFDQISDEEKGCGTLFSMQKQLCMELCQKHLTHYEKEGIAFLQRIIATNETWV